MWERDRQGLTAMPLSGIVCSIDGYLLHSLIVKIYIYILHLLQYKRWLRVRYKQTHEFEVEFREGGVDNDTI